jgi:arylsulfatase A-like enzyme
LNLTDYISVRGSNQPAGWKRNTVLLPAKYEMQLPLSEVTIAEALKENGYSTFFAGKWHLGGDGFTPSEQGFDVNQGGYHFGTPPGGYHSPYNNPKLSDDAPGTELPIRLAKETAKFITEKGKAKKPYFAMLSFYSVHGPIQCSKARWEKYRAKAEAMGLIKNGSEVNHENARFLFDRTKEVRQVQDHPIYAGMMAALDDAVGVVLDAVKQSGTENDTVIIFTSDNGGVSSGDGFATSCLPMRGGKGRQWEGGIRQPYYIAVPGVTKGEVTNVPATGTDFYPTILELAGLPQRTKQHLDGVSLVPAIKGNEMESRPLFWHYPHYGNQGGEPSAMMIDGDWKLIHYFEDKRDELYQIADDIGERKDLASSELVRVSSMQKNLRNWLKSVDAQFPTKNAKYNAEANARSQVSINKVGMPNREKQHAAFLKSKYLPRGGWWDQRAPKK